MFTITRSPWKSLRTTSPIDALMDAARTVNTVTTAIPIISAVAAPAVERGLRIALRRANDPVVPRTTVLGVPSRALAGRATAGPRSTSPTTVSSAPGATMPKPPPSAPATTRATPAPVATSPATVRFRDGAVASVVPSCIAATGRTRDAAHRGHEARRYRDRNSDRGRDGQVGRHQGEAGVGHTEADRAHERVEPGREPDAHGHADDRRHGTDDQPLHRRCDHDLPARRPECAQQRRLARALRGDDGERVVDAERGHEERDAGEHEEHRLEEADERALDVVPLLGGELVSGDRGDVGRERRPQARHQG